MIPEPCTTEIQHYLISSVCPRIAPFCLALQQRGWQTLCSQTNKIQPTLLSPMVYLVDFTCESQLPSNWDEIRQKPEIVIVGLFEQAQTNLVRTALNAGLVHFLFIDGSLDEAILRIESAKKQIHATLNSMIKFNDALGSDLTLIEQKILNCFLSDPTQSSTRKQLFETVWRKNHVHAKTLDVHLFNLRRKLKPLGLKIVFHARLSAWRLEKSSSVSTDQEVFANANQ